MKGQLHTAGFEAERQLRVCMFGIYDAQYSRNSIIVSGLRKNGVEVIECTESPEDPRRYIKLIRRLRDVRPRCDVIFAAYPAPLPTIFAKLYVRVPIVTDALMSMYDTVVNDRKEYSWYNPRSLKLLFSDWLSVLCADAVVTDTEEHAMYWKSWAGLAHKRTLSLPIGSEPEIFSGVVRDGAIKPVTVTFHGTYIPLQGIEKIVDACALLAHRADITWRFVGDGQTFESVQARILEKGLKDRIELVRRVPYKNIPAYLAASEIVLGIFGNSAKAGRAVPNKVYEGLAAGKTVITRDSPAIREVFDEEDLVLVENTPSALADAIQAIKDDPVRAARLAKNGQEKIIRLYSPEPLGNMLAKFLSDAIKNKK